MKTFVMRLLLLLAALTGSCLAIGVGGKKKIDDLNSKEVLAAAQAVVRQLNTESNSIFGTLLIEVVDGTEQVVAGIKYVLTIRVGTSSDCKKGEERDDVGNCHISDVSVWCATVFHQSWSTPAYEVTDLSEIDSNDVERKEGGASTPGMVGAPSPLKDLHNQYVLEAAAAGLKQLNKRSNSKFLSVLVDVVDGTSQVVAGIKYSLTVLVGISQCENDARSAILYQCPVQLNTVCRYKMVVWQHPTEIPTYDVLDIEISE